MRIDAATPKNDNTNQANVKSTVIRPPFKKEKTLALLILKGPAGLTQLEALNVYGESCLHTSISTLQNKHGIMISREADMTTVKHYGQKPFYRYWLADGLQVKKCINLLNHLRTKRGVETSIGISPELEEE